MTQVIIVWRMFFTLVFPASSHQMTRCSVMQGHGRAVDWWAFGVLIYEMLAGYPPFYEEDTAQTYQRILHGRFTFPSDFPVTVRDLVRKLLQVRSAGTA